MVINMNKVRFLTSLIDWVVSLVEIILGLRIVLVFLGARSQAWFTQWVYETSDQLLRPFAGMFETADVRGGFTLDFTALFALIIYAIVGYLLQELVLTISVRSSKRK